MEHAIRVEDYIVNVSKIAHKLSRRLPRSIDVRDLIQDGIVGLYSAASKWDSSIGIDFMLFASKHIRGEMFDGMRKSTYAKQWTIKVRNRRMEAEGIVEQRLGRKPHDQEVAAVADMTMKQYHNNVAQTFISDVGSLDTPIDTGIIMDTVSSTADFNPEQTMIAKQEQLLLDEVLPSAIGSLSYKERVVILGFYMDGKMQKDIASEIDSTEDYVWHIKKRALNKLGRFLKDKV